MRIAINTRFLQDDYPEGYGNFLYEIFSRITKKNPEHGFIFIFDRDADQRFVSATNIKAVIAGPPPRHPLLWKLWYDVKLPALLKKHKADVFVSCDGICSLRAKIPQCLLIPDLAFLHSPEGIRKSHILFYKKYTPLFLEKADAVATASEFSKQDILSHYGIPPEKISVIYNGVNEIFQPLAEEIKTRTKEKFTGGKEYFVYAGFIHPRKNLMNLLKAFSVFKKRQQTNMKLVLAGKLAQNYESFTESLKSYKYRNDVVLTGYMEDKELANIIGSAYGMICPSRFEGFAVPAIMAMKAAVPVITITDSAMQEITNDAALYANAGDYKDIAEKMMLLYKDENKRKDLVRQGTVTAQQYNWDRTADLLWQSIQKACLSGLAAP
jgi:glycosyltransferase involved in cell wall biosynthesis